MPKVSVIIPIYNAEKYLAECLDSIQNQTFKEIEIICVDDGSKDNSYKILEEYALKDNRFKILKQENLGAASARNKGIEKARGDYLLFLDGDDIFEYTLIEKCLHKACKYNVDIVIYNALAFNTNTGMQSSLNDKFTEYKIYENEVFSYKDISNNIFNSFLIPAWNKFYSRDLIFRNKLRFQNIKRSNDLYFTQTSLVVANRIILLDEFLVNYRIGMNTNLQSNNQKSPLDFYFALKKLYQFLDEKNLYNILTTSYSKLYLDVVFYNINTINDKYTNEKILNTINGDKYLLKNINVNSAGLIYKVKLCLLKKFRSPFFIKMIYVLSKMEEYYKQKGIKSLAVKLLSKI